MQRWFASHRERVAYGLAAALLVVSLGTTTAGAVLLRQSANNQRESFRLQSLAAAGLHGDGLRPAFARVQAHDPGVARRLGGVYTALLAGRTPQALSRFEAAVNGEFERLANAARDRYPIARWVLVSAATAFVLLIGVLVWLFELQRRAGRLDRDNARLRDEFVAVVSHELRTPLTSILGYVEMIEDENHGTLSAEQLSYFEVVKRNAGRLLSLVGDLLLVAETDAGHLRLDLRDLDLQALVDESVEAARAAADRKSVELRASAAPARLSGDPLRLAQMLDNLLSNAIKFTPAGGSVSVSTAVQDTQVVLEVADSGVGIAPGDRHQIFERFYRARSSTKQPVGGAGLGLAITKAIVEAHGGSIAVESELGLGTTFRVRLPLATAAERPALAAAASA